MSTEHDEPVGDAPMDEAHEGEGGEPEVRHSRRGHRRSIPGENIGHLNLTPMMDIMTMLLVFLVKSFASEPDNINVNLTLHPPESTTEAMMEAATKVTVTSEVILVDDKVVMPLSSVSVGEGKQATIPQLRDALLERADHLKALENIGGSPFDGRLLVVAHETTPYAILTSVLVTAGESKFAEYKLVVMQKGGEG
ncbi:MAG: biopolymer transporter ExbD [Myxococcota bacterium]